MAKLLGKAPNQVPTNADLGSMAFQDREGVNVNNAIIANLVITSALTSNAPFAVVNTSANVLYAAANGNVGIGTNVPGYKLTVYGNTAYFGAFNTTGATNIYVDSPTAQSAAIAFRQGGGNSIDIGTRKSNTSVFTIRETASGSERITFVANSTVGSVGINNTAPVDALAVGGNVVVTTGGGIQINSTNQTRALSIYGNSTVTETGIQLKTNAASAAFALLAAGGTFVLKDDSDASPRFEMDTAANLFNFVGGNVSIGNSTVNTIITSNSLLITDGSGGVANVSNAGIDFVLQDAGTSFKISRNSLGGSQLIRITTNASGAFINAISTAANPKPLTFNVSAGSNATYDTAYHYHIDSVAKLKANSSQFTTFTNTYITGDATVTGNLTVSGTTTYINTTTLNIGDNIITLNADLGAVAPSENAGIEVNRGTSVNTYFYWNENRSRWGAYPPATFAGVSTTMESYGNNAAFRVVATGNSTSNTIVAIDASVDTATMMLDSSNSISAAALTTRIDLKSPDYRGSGVYVTQTTAPIGGANAYWFMGKPYTGGGFQIGYGTSPEYQSNAIFFVSSSNTNIGIGNNAPAHKLVVAGRGYFGGTLDAIDSVSISSGDATSNATAQMLTSGNAYARIELGGTTGSYIDLKSPFADDYDLRMSFISGVGSITTTTDFYISNTVGGMALFAANGNVGIGNNTPGDKLSVGGNIVATGNLTLQTNTSYISVASNTNYTGAKIQAFTLSLANTSYQPVLSLVHQQNIGTDYAWTWRTAASLPLLLSHSNAGGGWTTFTDVFAIAANGNVGIGNTAPAAKLHVTGVANNYEASVIINNANTTGAGAEAKIHFVSNGYTTFLGQSPSGFTFLTGNSGDALNLYGGTNAGTVLGANAVANVVYITANGNVGVGNSAPSERFSVVGNVYANNIRRYTLQRTLSTTANDTVDIGSFVNGSGGHNLQVAIHVSDSNFSVAKQWTIASQFNATAGTFRKLLPDRDTGPYALNDFDLEASHTNDTLTLRIRRTGGTNAGTAVILVEDLSIELGDDSFTPSTTTATAVAAVTDLYPGSRVVQFGTASSNAFVVAANLTTNAITSNNTSISLNLPVTIGNYMNLNGVGGLQGFNLTTSATTANQVLNSQGSATWRACKYFIQVTSGSSYQSTEITLIHDGTNVYKTEYGQVYTGAVLATFDADINTGSLRLLTTPTNAVTSYRGTVTMLLV